MPYSFTMNNENQIINNVESEVWKPVVGYEGLYEVSNIGRVRSINFHNSGKAKVMRPSLNTWGYLIVDLRKNNKRHSYTVHRLVAFAFIPNPDNLPEINHKNEIKYDNTVENLEWCTRKYNMNYGTGNERRRRRRRIKPIVQLDNNGNVVRKWETGFAASRYYQVNRRCIYDCLHGKQKTCKGFVWKYEYEVT